ncbi:MAG: hypothetical protein OEZ36_06290 [Spirochaetota bacterium]|nr:hypothetical protein [Spirochaetota bacterium]
MKNYRSKILIGPPLIILVITFSLVVLACEKSPKNVSLYSCYDHDFKKNLKDSASIVSLSLSCRDDISDKQFKKILSLKNLQELMVFGSKELSDESIAELAKLDKLKVILFSHCAKIKGWQFAQLDKLPSLKILKLSGSPIDDKGLEQIAKLVHLEELDLESSNKITDSGLAQLKKLDKLKIINIRGNVKITEKGLGHLMSLKNIKDINARFTSSDNLSPEFMKRYPNYHTVITLRDGPSVNMGVDSASTSVGGSARITGSKTQSDKVKPRKIKKKKPQKIKNNVSR